jgi:virginiamycin B lyase
MSSVALPRPRRLASVRVVVTCVGLALVVVAGLAVVRTGLVGAAEVVEYRLPDTQDIPSAIALAPDGAVWFTLDSSNAIGWIQGGQIHKIARGGETIEALGLAVDAAGGVWMTDISGQAIRHLARDGSRDSVGVPGALAQLGRLASGPDGAIWFADSWGNSITRLTGQELRAYPAAEANAAPFGVAVDKHGTVWATLQIANKLMRIDPDGTVSELDLPTGNAVPTDIALDDSGGVWFTELRANKIARLLDGRFTEFPVPGEAVGLTALAVAPDESVWFTELRRQSLGRLRDGSVTEFALPRRDARPFGLAISEDGDVWYTDLSGWLGRLPAAQAQAVHLDIGRMLGSLAE